MDKIKRFKEILREIKTQEVYKDYVPLWDKNQLFKEENNLAYLLLSIENNMPFGWNWVDSTEVDGIVGAATTSGGGVK